MAITFLKSLILISESLRLNHVGLIHELTLQVNNNSSFDSLEASFNFRDNYTDSSSRILSFTRELETVPISELETE